MSSSSESYNRARILDYGATDHMMLIYDAFVSYEPCPSSKKVQTADGNLTTKAGVGSIQLKPIRLSTHVLHIPKLFVRSTVGTKVF